MAAALPLSALPPRFVCGGFGNGGLDHGKFFPADLLDGRGYVE
jgi:hypothetical protein